jgi:hypothetical protein
MILDILTVLFFVLGFVLILRMIGERRRDVLYGPYVTKEVPANETGCIHDAQLHSKSSRRGLDQLGMRTATPGRVTEVGDRFRRWYHLKQ